MNLKNITKEDLKEHKELISVVLLGGAAVLAVLICVEITQFFLLSTETENVILTSIKHSVRAQEDVDNALTNTETLAQTLAMNNLFAPAPRQQTTTPDQPIPVNPITEITAILDNSACINGAWYSPGEDVRGSTGNARIVDIGIDYVTVQFNGITQKMYPLDATTYASDLSNMSNPMNMSSLMGGGRNISINLNGTDISGLVDRFMGGRTSGGMMGGMMGGGGGRGGRGGGGGRGGRGGGGGRGGFGGFGG